MANSGSNLKEEVDWASVEECGSDKLATETHQSESESARSKCMIVREELTKLAVVMADKKDKVESLNKGLDECQSYIDMSLNELRTDMAGKHVPELDIVELLHEIRLKILDVGKREELMVLSLCGSKFNDDLEDEEERSKHKNSAERPPLRCYWCHQEGHLKRNCPQRRDKRAET